MKTAHPEKYVLEPRTLWRQEYFATHHTARPLLCRCTHKMAEMCVVFARFLQALTDGCCARRPRWLSSRKMETVKQLLAVRSPHTLRSVAVAERVCARVYTCRTTRPCCTRHSNPLGTRTLTHPETPPPTHARVYVHTTDCASPWGSPPTALPRRSQARTWTRSSHASAFKSRTT